MAGLVRVFALADDCSICAQMPPTCQDVLRLDLLLLLLLLLLFTLMNDAR